MSARRPSVNAEAVVARLLRLLTVPGVSGEEAAIAAAVTDELRAVGVPAHAIRHDTAHERIELPTQTGNLFVDLPGTAPGPRLLFATHLDTVPMCRGVKPRRDGGRIVSDGTTALGGDNRTGCAVLIGVAEALLAGGVPHPPVALLFTVREESGLQGARRLDPTDLAGIEMCFNVDGKLPAELIRGAVGQESFTVEIEGAASHAGVAPERGISATLAGALALEQVHRQGWFGKVVQPAGRGTSNIGVFGGRDGRAAGEATNVVTDYALLKGEARSPDAVFARAIAAAYRAAFEEAAGRVRDVDGNAAQVRFEACQAYPPFELADDAPAVAWAVRTAAALGHEPKLVSSNGGLDANWLVAHGVPTVTIGSGQHEIHTVHEFVEIDEFLAGCELAIALATFAE